MATERQVKMMKTAMAVELDRAIAAADDVICEMTEQPELFAKVLESVPIERFYRVRTMLDDIRQEVREAPDD